MCTQTRRPSPSRRSESASSKSLAPGGSTVIAVRSRRSMRSGSRPSGSRAALRASAMASSGNGRATPASTSRPAQHGARVLAASRAPRGCARGRARAARPPAPPRAPAPRRGARASAARPARRSAPPPGSARAARRRRRSAPRGPPAPSSRAHERDGAREGVPARDDVGRDAHAVQVVTGRRAVHGDGELEGAAAGQRVDGLDRGLAERVACPGAWRARCPAGPRRAPRRAEAVWLSTSTASSLYGSAVPSTSSVFVPTWAPAQRTTGPRGRKTEAVSTASSSRPPGLPRRSSTIRSWPRASARTRPAVPSEKLATRITRTS